MLLAGLRPVDVLGLRFAPTVHVADRRWPVVRARAAITRVVPGREPVLLCARAAYLPDERPVTAAHETVCSWCLKGPGAALPASAEGRDDKSWPRRPRRAGWSSDLP